MTRKAGSVPAETRAAILSSALQEFKEKGFQHSSLRTIASNAGVTTGAIYCFFRNKDELFDEIIGNATVPFLDFLQRHHEYEMGILASPEVEQGSRDPVIAENIIDFYMKNRDIWEILLHHQEHPSVQKFRKAFMDESIKHYMTMLKMLGRYDEGMMESFRFAITQFVRIQDETMMSLFESGFSKDEMIEHALTSMKMLRGAFHALLKE